MIVTAFFITVPKISFLLVFIKLYSFVFIELYFFSSKFLLPLGLFSILIGILLSLYSTKFKRLYAYSAIANTGYIIIAAASISIALANLNVFLVYLITYILSSISLFSILLGFRKKDCFYKLRNLTELSNLLRANPALALIFSVFFLSAAGIPPLSGFFGKFYVIAFLLEQDAYYLSGVLMLFSVASSIYYIRLIRFIYFDNSKIHNFTSTNNIPTVLYFVISFTFCLNCVFLFLQDPLLIFFHTIAFDF